MRLVSLLWHVSSCGVCFYCCTVLHGRADCCSFDSTPPLVQSQVYSTTRGVFNSIGTFVPTEVKGSSIFTSSVGTNTECIMSLIGGENRFSGWL